MPIARRKPSFGHAPATLAFWRRLTAQALRRTPTPFYLFSIEPCRNAVAELDALSVGLPVRHWLSCKTQPVRPLLEWWRVQGRNIEVVSEFEFLAARRTGFPPERILLNGPAKHHWLPRHAIRGLSVNFDSAAEAKALLPLALKLNWRVGVRFLTSEEHDSETPEYPTQFGLAPAEAVPLSRWLRRAGARLEIAHFHLRTNVASAQAYARALREVAAVCRAAGFAPRFVDCGGGWPPPNVLDRDGRRVDHPFRTSALADALRAARPDFPALEAWWLENGRFVSARSGALVLRVLDVKERRGLRQLICDGGRTTQALVSNWEQHALLTLPERRGAAALTTVCGPTCMAFDQLARRAMPRSVRAGDHLIWLDAGAYHVPWETRFSHGLARVLWHDGATLREVRAAESFDEWWGRWRR